MTGQTGSQAAYARHREVSKQTVTDWKSMGLVVFAEDGKVDFDATDAALKDHGIRQPVDGEDDSDLHDDALKLLTADGSRLWSKAEAEQVKENYAARLKQLEFEREAAGVVTVEDAALHIAGECAVVRKRLHRIGADIAPTLANATSATEIKSIIDGAVIEALTELSDIVA